LPDFSQRNTGDFRPSVRPRQGPPTVFMCCKPVTNHIPILEVTAYG